MGSSSGNDRSVEPTASVQLVRTEGGGAGAGPGGGSGGALAGAGDVAEAPGEPLEAGFATPEGGAGGAPGGG